MMSSVNIMCHSSKSVSRWEAAQYTVQEGTLQNTWSVTWPVTWYMTSRMMMSSVMTSHHMMSSVKLWCATHPSLFPGDIISHMTSHMTDIISSKHMENTWNLPQRKIERHGSHRVTLSNNWWHHQSHDCHMIDDINHVTDDIISHMTGHMTDVIINHINVFCQTQAPRW